MCSPVCLWSFAWWIPSPIGWSCWTRTQLLDGISYESWTRKYMLDVYARVCLRSLRNMSRQSSVAWRKEIRLAGIGLLTVNIVIFHVRLRISVFSVDMAQCIDSDRRWELHICNKSPECGDAICQNVHTTSYQPLTTGHKHTELWNIDPSLGTAGDLPRSSLSSMYMLHWTTTIDTWCIDLLWTSRGDGHSGRVWQSTGLHIIIMRWWATVCIMLPNCPEPADFPCYRQKLCAWWKCEYKIFIFQWRQMYVFFI